MISNLKKKKKEEEEEAGRTSGMESTFEIAAAASFTLQTALNSKMPCRSFLHAA